jgi:hypothetical protein
LRGTLRVKAVEKRHHGLGDGVDGRAWGASAASSRTAGVQDEADEDTSQRGLRVVAAAQTLAP